MAVERAGRRDRRPSRQERLPLLTGASFEQIDELRPRVAMQRKGDARREPHELHRAAGGAAEILHCDTCGGERPLKSQRRAKSVYWRSRHFEETWGPPWPTSFRSEAKAPPAPAPGSIASMRSSRISKPGEW